MGRVRRVWRMGRVGRVWRERRGRGRMTARHQRHAHVAHLQPLHAQPVLRQRALRLARRPAAAVHEEWMLHRGFQLHLRAIPIVSESESEPVAALVEPQ